MEKTHKAKILTIKSTKYGEIVKLKSQSKFSPVLQQKIYKIYFQYYNLFNFICKTKFHPLRDLQLQFKSEK